jgi:hypothetical protein
VNSGQARDEARRILSERRFHGTTLPRPFHGILDWLSRHLHFVARGWDWLVLHVGGADVLWALLGGVVVAIAVVAATRLARRRVGLEVAASGGGGRGRSEDPGELEREADRAERSGDLEAALRLRFRAGLLRLGRARVLPERPSLRTLEARRTLRNARFDGLARAFDEVVYGRRAPLPVDIETARAEWPRVLEETRR